MSYSEDVAYWRGVSERFPGSRFITGGFGALSQSWHDAYDAAEDKADREGIVAFVARACHTYHEAGRAILVGLSVVQRADVVEHMNQGKDASEVPGYADFQAFRYQTFRDPEKGFWDFITDN